MHAVVGALLLAATIVLFQFAYVYHRWPGPVRLASYEMFSQLICVAIVLTFMTGVGLLINFFIDPVAFTLADGGVVVAGFVAASVAVTAIHRAWLRRRGEAGPAAGNVHALQLPPEGSGPGSWPRGGMPGGKRRAA